MSFITKKDNKELAIAMQDQILKRTSLLRESKMWKDILSREVELVKKEPNIFIDEWLDLCEIPGFILLKGKNANKGEPDFISLFIGSSDLDFLALELYPDRYNEMQWKVNDFPEDDYTFRPATEKECLSFFVQLKKFRF